MKTETCKLYSRDFWIFLPKIIKIYLYNSEPYRFKVGAFFETQCIYKRNLLICYSNIHQNCSELDAAHELSNIGEYWPTCRMRLADWWMAAIQREAADVWATDAHTQPLDQTQHLLSCEKQLQQQWTAVHSCWYCRSLFCCQVSTALYRVQ